MAHIFCFVHEITGLIARVALHIVFMTFTDFPPFSGQD